MHPGCTSASGRGLAHWARTTMKTFSQVVTAPCAARCSMQIQALSLGHVGMPWRLAHSLTFDSKPLNFPGLGESGLSCVGELCP